MTIGPDDYAVYNHPERPGIGRDHLGNYHYNCFYVSLEKENTGSYKPYLFSDFIKQYNQYHKHSETCASCISHNKLCTFNDVDRSSVHRKFWQKSWEYDDTDIDVSQYYYCPLIYKVITLSEITAFTEYELSSSGEKVLAEPISAILGILDDGWYANSWDDNYFFRLQSIGIPDELSICPILKNLASPSFIGQKAERLFLKLYISSVFYYLNTIAQKRKNTYLEEKDFNHLESKFFSFLFPIPQVWVYVIPKPPPGVKWKEWEVEYSADLLPQRVDFMFTYEGKRHIIELDGRSHYGVNSNNAWLASEEEYRKTLIDIRWLRRCDFEVHHFTNEEIFGLTNPTSNEFNLEGFIDLLYSEGLELEKMIFLRN